MKTRNVNVVSGVGIEPTEVISNARTRKDLQACKPEEPKRALQFSTLQPIVGRNL